MKTSPLSLAWRTVRRSPGRSALMGAGLVVGVLSISLTVATGEGTRRQIQRSFRAMFGALDVLFVQPGGSAQRGMANQETSIATLTPEDAEAIRTSVPNVSAVGVQQNQIPADFEAGGKAGTTAAFASSANWATLRGDSIADGVFYTEDDNRALARVAVIGSDVARDYFTVGSPVGQHLRLRGVDFTVVGVLAPNGAGPGGVSIDNVIYFPIETGRRRVFNRDHLNLVSVKLVAPSKWAETQASIRTLLRQRHGRVNADLDDFRVSSPQAVIARVANVDTTLGKALYWVGAFALCIGGVIVANLMFAATVSRRQEIATRRAVGATSTDILRQFWLEAMLISVLASLMGIALAAGVTAMGSSMMRMPMALSWRTTLATVGATVMIGLLAGFLPARRAAGMAPGDVLRHAA